MSEPWSADPIQRTVGEWLASNHPHARISEVAPIITYYAHGTIVRLPWTDSEKARRYVEKQGVEFVVLQSIDLGRRPYLHEWYQQPTEPLTLVKTFKSVRNEVRVYRVNTRG